MTQLAKLTKSSSDSSKRTVQFPKFSGKDFPKWYDNIISILASPQWKELYDPVQDDAISTEPGSDLSSELFTCLKRCLHGEAQDTMLNKKGARSKGILFLQMIKATYNPLLSTLERDEKQREFLSIARNKEESTTKKNRVIKVVIS